MSRIQRILKIYKVEFPVIGCLFTNGEYRVINIIKFFQALGIEKGQFGFELTEKESLFNAVTLENHTLSWKELTKHIKLPSGSSRTLVFELDPITVFENSKLDYLKNDRDHIGRTIKNLRSKLKLSQETVAGRIASNKQYLSRIENDKSDLEFNTLKKIYEVGFNKKIYISHFDENNFLNTITQCLFTHTFIDWIEKNDDRLDLIEGIGPALINEFEKNKIKSTEELANTSFENITHILASCKNRISSYHYPESWSIQAKYLQRKDWFSLIKIQRMLISKPDSNERSKLEIIARRETKHDLFEIE
ncbi:MAG: helix-turn-helix transcriptional regulator [Saprospiraceae bacterium]